MTVHFALDVQKILLPLIIINANLVGCRRNATTTVKPRIVGGHLATAGQFPFQVGIIHNVEGLLCGGTILNDRWILSAAHCFEHKYGGHHTILVGTATLEGGTSYRVSKIVVHANYKTKTIENDISMVKTKEKIIFTDKVRPIGLETQYIPGEAECTVLGWGQVSFYLDNPATVLNYINVDTITNQECSDIYMSYAGKEIMDSNICTYSRSSGTGTCHMDSGGPLLDSRGKQIGIVSFGAKCGQYPDVYTRTWSFMKWINSNLLESDDQKKTYR